MGHCEVEAIISVIIWNQLLIHCQTFSCYKKPWVFYLMDNNQRFPVTVLTSALMCIPLYFISSLELCLQHMWGLPPSHTIFAGINSDVVVSVICRKRPCYGYLSLQGSEMQRCTSCLGLQIISSLSDGLSVHWLQTSSVRSDRRATVKMRKESNMLFLAMMLLYWTQTEGEILFCEFLPFSY